MSDTDLGPVLRWKEEDETTRPPWQRVASRGEKTKAYWAQWESAQWSVLPPVGDSNWSSVYQAANPAKSSANRGLSATPQLANSWASGSQPDSRKGS